MSIPQGICQSKWPIIHYALCLFFALLLVYFKIYECENANIKSFYFVCVSVNFWWLQSWSHTTKPTKKKCLKYALKRIGCTHKHYTVKLLYYGQRWSTYRESFRRFVTRLAFTVNTRTQFVQVFFSFSRWWFATLRIVILPPTICWNLK